MNYTDLYGSFVLPLDYLDRANDYLKNYPFDKVHPLPNIVRFPAFHHKRLGSVTFAMAGVIPNAFSDEPEEFYEAFIKMITGLECRVVGSLHLESDSTPYVDKISFILSPDNKEWEFSAHKIEEKEVSNAYFPKKICNDVR